MIHQDDTFGTLNVTAEAQDCLILEYAGWKAKLHPQMATYEYMMRGDLSELYFRERLVMPFIRLLRGSVLLHAGAIALDSKCIAILASSGIGKSTLTAGMLAVSQAKLMSDDILSLFWNDEKACISALPGSSHLAMRHDMFDDESFVCAKESSPYKHLLHIAPSRCQQSPSPLQAIVILEPAQRPEYHPLSIPNALPILLKQQMTISNGSDGFKKQQFHALMRCLSHVPCYRLCANCSTRSEVEHSASVLNQLISELT